MNVNNFKLRIVDGKCAKACFIYCIVIIVEWDEGTFSHYLQTRCESTLREQALTYKLDNIQSGHEWAAK